MNSYKEENAVQLSDEEALKKANSVMCTAKFEPKKVAPKTARKTVQDMSDSELESEWFRNNERLNTFAQMPKEVRSEMRDKIVKLVGFISYLKHEMKKRDLVFDGLVSDDSKYLKAEISKLSKQVAHLKNQNEQLLDGRSSLKQQRKIENIKVARDRDVLIHMSFKKLVKEYLGEPEYMALIRQATEIAEQNLMSREQ